MMNDSVSNVAVVIRSAHERTEALCVHLAQQQVIEKNVVLIHERPFSEALRRSFEIGIELGMEWTLCVDADVLLKSSGIREFVSAVENAPESTYIVEAKVLDKLFNNIRSAGAHLYRTKLLKIALDKAEFSADAIRPESYVRDQMVTLGFSMLTVPIVIGIHDYFQYYRDIYRKCFVHFHKHTERFYRQQMWNYLSKFDTDFKVALLGSRAARNFHGTVRIDINEFPSNIDSDLKSMGLSEKLELGATDISFNEVDHLVSNYSNEYWVWRNSFKRKQLELVRMYSQFGPVYFFPELARTVVRHIK